MSMSQEEIEALMNGLDISEDESESPEPENNSVNTDEIEELLSQTDDIKEEVKAEESTSEVETNETLDNDSIEDLLKEVNSDSENENDTSESEDIISNSTVSNDDIDDLLKGIEGIDDEPQEEDDTVSLSDDDIEDLLNTDDLESISEEPKAEEPNIKQPITSKEEDEIVRSWASDRIDEGVIPWPADKDTKVVNQLSQVANDSEEKVGQIFDVLSLSLDNNNSVRTEIKNIQTFLDEEKKLLESLSQKFPNISIFSKHLAEISKINDNISVINNGTFEEDNKIFEAMELMQFNDINRQKIERVMSVIRKLSLYLNNLFEDEGSTKEIAVAKHIHGDDTDDLIGDDLDKLIEEFGNN